MKAMIHNFLPRATGAALVVASLSVHGMDWATAHGVRSGENANSGSGQLRAAGCAPATSTTELDLNNVRALLTTSGLLWYDKPANRAAYEVPKTPDRTGPKAIYSGGLWMGGLSPDNQLKLAAILYRQGNDFWPGPLTTDGSASVTDDICVANDRFYTNNLTDAERHDAYFRCLADPECDLAEEGLDNYIIPTSYFEWPAINTDQGYDTYLAPFTDVNDDGDYVPSDGDFPGFDLAQEVSCVNKFRTDPVPLFGDKNIWWVFNDKGNQHSETGGQPIGMEIKAQAFAFSTNNEVNNMTFYNYVLINRGTQTLNNTYFGQWADPDLGGADDDFTGCDVQRGLGYVYNGDDNDADQEGTPGYGFQPPAVGIDFFEGPFQDYDGLDNPGPLTSQPYPDCAFVRDNGGIPYKGIGIGYGDGVPDNERFGMRAFLYFSREATSCCNDPALAVHYYNYLRSIWKDGTPMTHGGPDGYEPNDPNAVPTFYMFPGDSDPLGWGTDCQPQGAWSESDLANPDRRFVQSAGPFTLEPGAYNNITVGAVWARAVSGGAFASVEDLRRADDKAQSLFDNCFRILDGPDAPDIDIQELDQHLILYLSNPAGSNNNKQSPEDYLELDPTIPEQTIEVSVNQTIDSVDIDGVPPFDAVLVSYDTVTTITQNDRFYRFQGYQVFQVKDATVSVDELGDVNRARLLAVCDVRDGVNRIINYIQDPVFNQPVPTEMVNAPDTGVFHSLRVDFDLFAAGDPRLVNYRTYYYIAIAYGYNNYQEFNTELLSGQPFPYLAGRKAAAGSIRNYAGIPHPPSSEAGGTVQNSQYGDQFQITRIEGQGNGGNVLNIDASTEQAILNSPTGRVDQVKYTKGNGPINVKVIDPLNVPAGSFEVWFTDATELPNPNNYKDYAKLNDATWKIVRVDDQGNQLETVQSERTIEVGNEQLIPQWGISVTLDQTEYTINNEFTEPLGITYEYRGITDANQFWYSPIPDADGENAFNWIRAGTADDDAITYVDYVGTDDDELYEEGSPGWAPFPLIGDTAFQPGDASIKSMITSADISECSSTLVVFTPNKAYWTRCPVVEECNNIALIPGGVAKMRIKTSPSIDKNGLQAGEDGYNPIEGDSVSATGMSWFPGYAIDLETGERQNMAFGEDSFWGGEIGRDMAWNPNDVLANSQGFALMAGNHWIYTFKNRRRNAANITLMPSYDNGRYIYERLASGTAADRTRVWSACNWVGSGALVPGASYRPWSEGFIPAELRVRLSVNKPFLTYLPYPGQPSPGVNIDRNGGLPLYAFSTFGSETQTGVNSVQEDGLSEIGIVPNPYYAFSGYETGRLDNRVKFVNLPRTCTISIYNVSGTLMRKYRKDNDLTYLDWDLKNSYNVPIAGGTYICHIEVPGAGETVLKWFGVMRPVDLQNF